MCDNSFAVGFSPVFCFCFYFGCCCCFCYFVIVVGYFVSKKTLIFLNSHIAIGSVRWVCEPPANKSYMHFRYFPKGGHGLKVAAQVPTMHFLLPKSNWFLLRSGLVFSNLFYSMWMLYCFCRLSVTLTFDSLCVYVFIGELVSSFAE